MSVYKRASEVSSVSLLSYRAVLISHHKSEIRLEGAHALLWNFLDGKRDVGDLVRDLAPWMNQNHVEQIIADFLSQNLIA